MPSKAAPPTPNIPDGRKSPKKPQRRVHFNELQFASDRDRRALKRQIQQPPTALQSQMTSKQRQAAEKKRKAQEKASSINNLTNILTEMVKINLQIKLIDMIDK